ncbi:MAG: hypothetical protein ACTS73_01525 [Arsenophonus sp. NEOnobi-MAG3]
MPLITPLIFADKAFSELSILCSDKKLEKDREELLAFYDFPSEHLASIRTINPIESVFLQ